MRHYEYNNKMIRYQLLTLQLLSRFSQLAVGENHLEFEADTQ